SSRGAGRWPRTGARTPAHDGGGAGDSAAAAAHDRRSGARRRSGRPCGGTAMSAAGAKPDVAAVGAGVLPLPTIVPGVGLGAGIELRRPRLTDVPAISRLLE